MLAWHVASNSIVTYSNYARCRSVGMETVARRCDRALAMRSSLKYREYSDDTSKACFPLTYFAVAGEKFRQPETLLVVL